MDFNEWGRKGGFGRKMPTTSSIDKIYSTFFNTQKPRHGKSYQSIDYLCPQTSENGRKSTKLIRIMYKILKYTRSLEQPFRPQHAEWVEFAGLALGIGSSIFGGLSSAAAARRAEQLRREQDARNNAWFNRKYNESYIDTAAGRNAIRQATDYARTMTQRAEGAAAVTGGTDAAVAQAKESVNKMIGDTIGNLAAQDTARKENAEATHLQQQAQSTAQQMQNQQMKANAIAQAASGASNALIQGAAMLGQSTGATKAASPSSNIPDSAIAPSQQEQAAITQAFNNKVEGNLQQVRTDYAAQHGLTLDEIMRPQVKDGLVQRWRK